MPANSLMRLSCVFALTILAGQCGAVAAEELTYRGTEGPGLGQRIVFLAGDHEYRSEESLPALARILAKRFGFECVVLFSTNRETGFIEPGSSYMTGLEHLDDADLMVIFLRFQDFPDGQMQHIDAYLQRGGPVVGLRTSTHAFKMPKDRTFAKYSFRHEGPKFTGGFGRAILGETWAGHYGKNHQMSTRLDIVADQKQHPILQGVDKMWVQAGGYWTEPRDGCTTLALAQPLAAMTPDAPPADGKLPCPGVWTTTYESMTGQTERVFTTTYGASEDLLNEGFRRLLVNACFWAMGLEDQINPTANVDFVGPYHPTTFRFEGYRRGVRPLDLAGWETPIMSPDRPTTPVRKAAQ